MGLPKPLRGVVPPMVTPLTEKGKLDEEGTERLVEHLLKGGVHGLFLLGTTGEGPSIGRRATFQFIENVTKQTVGRVPVLVGITAAAIDDMLELAEFSAEVGADAVVAAAPFYFPISGDEYLRHLEQLTAALPLPLFLYNMPSMTKLHMPLDVVRKALELPKVAGVKDSSGNFVYFQQVRRMMADRPELSLLMGPEEMLAQAVLVGAHGGVCGGANLNPRLYVAVYEAALAGDMPRLERLQEKVLQLTACLGRSSGYGAAFMSGLKASLRIAGLCGDTMASPLLGLSVPEREELARQLHDLQVLPDAPLPLDSLPLESSPTASPPGLRTAGSV